MKRTRMTRRTFVTGYEVDIDAVAAAILRDDPMRRLIAAWVSGGGRSHEARPEHPHG